MNHSSESASSRTAVERAEQLWDGVGQSLKTLTVRAGQKVGQTRASLQERLSHTGQTSTEPVGQPNSAPRMERAEQTVQAMEQRLGGWTSATGLQFRRTGARLRENAEDILAEARSIRQRNTSPS